MAIDLTGKTPQTTIAATYSFVVVDSAGATASDKAKLVDETAVGQLALMGVNAQTGTTYTLVASDNNKMVTFANAALVTVTLPNSLPAGFACSWIQKGAGQVKFVPASGAALRHFQSHNASGGTIYTEGALKIMTNGSGSEADYILSGITAAA